MQQGQRFQFYDFGASKGGSIRFAMSAFGGAGLGLDLDPKKIATLRASGLQGAVVDLAAGPSDGLLRENSVNYVTMFHFLEHLPDPTIGERVIANAVRAASDFVAMVGPDFEHQDYLASLGLRKYYAHWSGHKWHHSKAELEGILSKQGRPFTIAQGNPIRDSWSSAIQPVESKVNSHPYNPGTDPQKPFVEFDKNLYKAIGFVVNISGRFDTADLLLRLGYLLGLQNGRKPPLFAPAGVPAAVEAA